MPDYRTPGVIIEELRGAGGPIAGVGTSTAALLGRALRGAVNVPTKVTNWTQFVSTFIGDSLPGPELYLYHAARGFFDNGGSIAYVVRVGTAARAYVDLADRGAPPGTALRVEAIDEGTVGNSIGVEVKDAEIVKASDNVSVYKARTTVDAAGAGSTTLTVQTAADAALFRPGDRVAVAGVPASLEISRVAGDQVTLASPLSAAVIAGAEMRIADLAAGQTRFRLNNSNAADRIQPGSVIHLANATTNEDLVVDAVSDRIVTVTSPGLKNGYGLAKADARVAVSTVEFAMLVTKDGKTTPHDNLSMDPRHPRYFGAVITSGPVQVRAPEAPSLQPPPKNQPAVGSKNLANGKDDYVPGIGPNHYDNALAMLEAISDVNLVAAPGAGPAVHEMLVRHCEKLRDRFAILDAPQDGKITAPGLAASVSGYAAIYHPWIRVRDPVSSAGGSTIPVPPSGHMAGIYARSDAQRGVHKAPANEFINGALDLAYIMTDVEQGELNKVGINCLRVFPGQRPVVWGARTTAGQRVEWRYINVRRLLLFIEESIQEGIRWSVFEPNDQSLWKSLERTITEFLTRVWRSGALFGSTAKQAFYVKIDEELNPPDTRALGQVIIEIGVAPVRPAEFVIVRIAMWDGGSSAAAL